MDISTGEQAVRAHTADFPVFLEMVRIVFAAAYTQGRFDTATGFNSCTSLEEITNAWMSENEDLLIEPLPVDALMDRLKSEIQRMNSGARF